MFWKKKEENVPQKENPPQPPREKTCKKKSILLWEADVLPLHHKRVVENNTPSTFRRELFIYVYIDFLSSTLAGNRIRGSSCFFSLSLSKKKKKKKKTQSSFQFRHKVNFSFRV